MTPTAQGAASVIHDQQVGAAANFGFLREDRLRYRAWIARGLAHALLADAERPGGTAVTALRARAAAALGEDPSWLEPLARALGRLSSTTWQYSELESLSARIGDLPEFDAAFAGENLPHIQRLILRSARMRPRPLGLDGVTLPDLPTFAALADWIELDPTRLAWMAGDAQAFRESTAPHARHAARHYRALLMPKRQGGHRLLEVPKAELKAAQRRILEGLLQHIPAHEAAHGFVRGRSVIDHAAVHAGQALVMGFDLCDFFASIGASRVHGLWHTLGFPRGVARTLTRLTTARTDPAVLQRLRDDGTLDWMTAKRLASPHLPQGAPTSPVLANLCAFRLDLRLEGLAWAFGARYSRYADDIVLSGGETLRPQARTLAAWVGAIVEAEGFALNPRKTHLMPQHGQQRVTGLVVNTRPNVPRADFDRLKALLHRCAMRDPASQNLEKHADFRAYLLGRIAWVGQTNPSRRARLMRIFARIDWRAPAAGPSE